MVNDLTNEIFAPPLADLSGESPLQTPVEQACLTESPLLNLSGEVVDYKPGIVFTIENEETSGAIEWYQNDQKITGDR